MKFSMYDTFTMVKYSFLRDWQRKSSSAARRESISERWYCSVQCTFRQSEAPHSHFNRLKYYHEYYMVIYIRRRRAIKCPRITHFMNCCNWIRPKASSFFGCFFLKSCLSSWNNNNCGHFLTHFQSINPIHCHRCVFDNKTTILQHDSCDCVSIKWNYISKDRTKNMHMNTCP